MPYASIEDRRRNSLANYYANREKYLDQIRAKYNERKAEIAAKRKERYRTDEAYRERKKAKSRTQAKRNRPSKWHTVKITKEMVAAHNAARRARVLGATVERVNLARVRQKSNGMCGICGLQITAADKIHYDHIVPLVKGGAHSESNLQVTHATCNLRKGSKLAA